MIEWFAGINLLFYGRKFSFTALSTDSISATSEVYVLAVQRHKEYGPPCLERFSCAKTQRIRTTMSGKIYECSECEFFFALHSSNCLTIHINCHRHARLQSNNCLTIHINCHRHARLHSNKCLTATLMTRKFSPFWHHYCDRLLRTRKERNL